MTTTFLPTSPAAVSPRATFVATGSGLSLTGIVRSEWIKLRTVRATAWSFLIVVLISVGMAGIMSFALDLQGTGGSLPAADQAIFLVRASTFGVYFGQLVVAVLGVLMITGEYSTGMIKSTLTAVPRRVGALGAKVVVLFASTFVVGAVATISSFLVASPILAREGLHASLFEPVVIVPLLGAALYLALVSVFALGIGAVLRSGAGGIAAALGALLLLPIVFQMIPADWAHDLLPYLISNAGMGMFGLTMTVGILAWWQNLLILLGWVAVSLTAAAVLLKRRDA
ncbi:ABC transporter permease subunit [Glaciibacter psychrotolerans]|uniref:ABC-2 type transport system permease protein n=1 Tax=Glaciibacter psychrotolerans TaxID=670054 RepID=A0A7Z0EIC6_9MICO|nr:ABC transporter permease subunit [Leifsonia psychrotolerans]NYJ21407.1 ABC-2 type transport system permease protein [Leifsonia psychrotolerans]